MHIHKSKKIIAAIAIIVLILFSIIFMDSNEEQYIAGVRSTINELRGYSVQLDEIDLDKDPDKLLTTYENIIETAKKGLNLTPPTSMVTFNKRLENYLNRTIKGYYLLIEGTKNNDIELIKKGIKYLAQLDDSFLKQITTLDTK